MAGKEGVGEGSEGGTRVEESPGIVVTDWTRRRPDDDHGPRIAAFIWGGKLRSVPSLPYGRWRGAA